MQEVNPLGLNCGNYCGDDEYSVCQIHGHVSYWTCKTCPDRLSLKEAGDKEYARRLAAKKNDEKSSES